jgi:hypothetical protein
VRSTKVARIVGTARRNLSRSVKFGGSADPFSIPPGKDPKAAAGQFKNKAHPIKA